MTTGETRGAEREAVTEGLGEGGSANGGPRLDLEVVEEGVVVSEVLGPPEVPGSGGSWLVIAGVVPRDRHPVLVYLASLSPGSRRTMRASLETIAGFVSGGEADALSLAWTELRYQHAALIRAELARRYSPASANKMLSALRGVLRECFRLGYVSAEDYQRARDLPPVCGTALPKGRALSRDEIGRLFAACSADEKKARGTRDAALLAVLYGCGVRRSEAVSLDLADYEPGTGGILVRGKGNKERLVYAQGGVVGALAAWLGHRGDWEGPLFLPVNKGGKVQRRRMSDQAVLYILKKRGEQVTAEGFSPHDMRRTFIGDLLDAGADLAAVQRLAGHANVQTTARYDRRGERAKKEAASLLRVPHSPGG